MYSIERASVVAWNLRVEPGMKLTSRKSDLTSTKLWQNFSRKWSSTMPAVTYFKMTLLAVYPLLLVSMLSFFLSFFLSFLYSFLFVVSPVFLFLFLLFSFFILFFFLLTFDASSYITLNLLFLCSAFSFLTFLIFFVFSYHRPVFSFLMFSPFSLIS